MEPAEPTRRLSGLDEGVAEIRRRAREIARKPLVVGITGAVGSGKSTLASRLVHSHGACLVPTDAYLPDYDQVPELERDLPHHADLDLLARNIDNLRSAGRTLIPVWSFHSHRREGTREVTLQGTIIVIEGIHALDDRVHEHLDLRVLVEAPQEIRWARWERIESSGERGWGVERARDHFDRVAEPTYAARAERIRQLADIIVLNT